MQGFCCLPGGLAAQSQPHLSLLPGYKERASPHCPVLTGSTCLHNCQLNICMQTCKVSHKLEDRLYDASLLQHQSPCESTAQTHLAHHSTAQHSIAQHSTTAQTHLAHHSTAQRNTSAQPRPGQDAQHSLDPSQHNTARRQLWCYDLSLTCSGSGVSHAKHAR